MHYIPKTLRTPQKKDDDYIFFYNGGFGTAVYHIRAYRIIPLSKWWITLLNKPPTGPFHSQLIFTIQLINHLLSIINYNQFRLLISPTLGDIFQFHTSVGRKTPRTPCFLTGNLLILPALRGQSLQSKRLCVPHHPCARSCGACAATAHLSSRGCLGLEIGLCYGEPVTLPERFFWPMFWFVHIFSWLSR
jgi:hypothetical protein